MLCAYNENAQCVQCGKPTKFPSFVRQCCPGGECEQQSALESQVVSVERGGPGTELHALLGRFGLTASGDCKCRSRAAYMDRLEAEQPGWCEANIDEIVGWLRESAAERGLPFLDVAGRVLIRRAIATARRKEAARAEGSPLHPER